MTQEDKELLLKDLTARLPYGVKVYAGEDLAMTLKQIDHECFCESWENEDFKCHSRWMIPYLRPMSSMTEDELEELKSKCTHTETEEDWEGVRSDMWGIQILDKYDTRRWDNPIWPSTINVDAIDWLNAHHFDYRGIIEKGLAIAVTEENNPYKE